jgi:hypothetical protein
MPDSPFIGSCTLRLLADGSVELIYVDWMNNQRCQASLTTKADGSLEIAAVLPGGMA